MRSELLEACSAFVSVAPIRSFCKGAEGRSSPGTGAVPAAPPGSDSAGPEPGPRVPSGLSLELK